jgi:acetyl-CoA synthetase
MNSEDSLFILYTSGTTGKPKRNSTHTWRFYDGCCKTDGHLIDLKGIDTLFWHADLQILVGLLARLRSSMAIL